MAKTQEARKKDITALRKILKEKGNIIPSISFIWAEGDYPTVIHKNMNIDHVYLALEILTEYFATTAPETKEILHSQIETIYDNMYNNTESIN